MHNVKSFNVSQRRAISPTCSNTVFEIVTLGFQERLEIVIPWFDLWSQQVEAIYNILIHCTL